MKQKLKKIYTSAAILSPVLNVYGVSYSNNTFTIRELVFLLVLCLCIFDICNNKKIHGSKVLLFSSLYIISIIFSLCLNIFLGYSGFEMRALRYILLLIFTFFLAPEYFDYEFGMKIYKTIVVFASIVVFAQVLSANLFSYPLRGYLPFLPIRSSNLIHANHLRRYYSIFEEPGYYGMYCSGYLVLSLFRKKKELMCLLMICLASLLTTATTSIVCMVFVVALFLISRNNEKKDKRWVKRLKLAIILIVLVSAFVFLQSEQYNTVIYRLTFETSTADRFLGYETFSDIFSKFSFGRILFGNCLQEYPISGYAAMLIVCGLVGTILFAFLILSCFKTTDKVGKVLITLFLFINIANVEFLGNASTLIVYFGFILTSQYNKKQYLCILEDKEL